MASVASAGQAHRPDAVRVHTWPLACAARNAACCPLCTCGGSAAPLGSNSSSSTFQRQCASPARPILLPEHRLPSSPIALWNTLSTETQEPSAMAVFFGLGLENRPSPGCPPCFMVTSCLSACPTTPEAPEDGSHLFSH